MVSNIEQIRAFQDLKKITGWLQNQEQIRRRTLYPLCVCTWCHESPASALRKTFDFCAREVPTFPVPRTMPTADLKLRIGFDLVDGYFLESCWVSWRLHLEFVLTSQGRGCPSASWEGGRIAVQMAPWSKHKQNQFQTCKFLLTYRHFKGRTEAGEYLSWHIFGRTKISRKKA